MLVAACAPGAEPFPVATTRAGTEPVASRPSTTITAPPSTTSTITLVGEATTTTSAATTTTGSDTASSPPLPDIGLEILVPEGKGPFPAVVLVHGGGWVAGSPALMADLARFLSDRGYLTVNTPYTLAGEVPGFPVAVDDVACAVRYAAAQPEADGTVAVLGHSAGAHLSALVALDDGEYGEDCPLETPVIPKRLVGLAGPYDVARLGPLMLPFFGTSPTEDPAAWGAGNPMYQVEKNPGLSSLLLHGEEDGFVDLSFAEDFAAALTDAGSEALVEVVEGASHNDMHDPVYVGDLVVTWLDR
jgi:acetyl esterase/lipase